MMYDYPSPESEPRKLVRLSLNEIPDDQHDDNYTSSFKPTEHEILKWS